METVKDGSPARLGDQQARPEPSSLEPLPLAPISMLWASTIYSAGFIGYTVRVQLISEASRIFDTAYVRMPVRRLAILTESVSYTHLRAHET